MNAVIVTGKVERAEAKALDGDRTLVTFNLIGAYEEEGRVRNFVVPVSLFGAQARRFDNGLEGQEVAVVGSLRQRTWENDKKEKRSAVSLVARYLYRVAHAEAKPFGKGSAPFPAVNQVNLQGRLVATPESSERGPLRVTLAVSRDYVPEGKERPDADFIDITIWSPLAEALAQAEKGDPLTVFGRFNRESWEKDGKTHYAARVTATGVVPGIPLVLEPAAS
ncbi:single-strand binding protein/Primosomal replication protein n (plasmid) [Oceanithermus profundus DSM 14977]|uniref:Single-strand binding protein/Primosomal replication protein n n=1 Tax=Oceanithermus profundus (strain DSM 14977 / NBRC 100410 / VKM B-2274 / 506) TaxID=670487 RepID=E4UAJ2_OCEP5|nr:single-stranded DNA-binding protein [Oceanithermus profundus]ADR37771.1 single-strand binding protein/Primosomal replication protein n [Oceanithermus profundus DSM 14977]